MSERERQRQRQTETERDTHTEERAGSRERQLLGKTKEQEGRNLWKAGTKGSNDLNGRRETRRWGSEEGADEQSSVKQGRKVGGDSNLVKSLLGTFT